MPDEGGDRTGTTVVIGAIVAAIGVALGALGAHGWRQRLDVSDRRRTFETAVHYQIWHALGMLVVSVLADDGLVPPGTVGAAWLFLSGILLFSGSLYLLSFRPLGRWGLITPLGGLLLLAGWVWLAVGAWLR